MGHAEQWFAEAGTEELRPAAEIHRKLRDEGITHIYVNWAEIIRYRTTYGYTDFVTPEKFRTLQNARILGPAWNIPEAFTPLEALGFPI